MKMALFFLVVCLGVFAVVEGCGTLQIGREKIVNFTVTDFKLPAIMAFSGDVNERKKVSTLSASMSDAQTFVINLIMRTVKDVLYDQGRSAFLSDSVISTILQQFDVEITYDPLECEIVVIDTTFNGAMMNKVNCIIIGGTVTNICNAGAMCAMGNIGMNLIGVPSKHLSISGSLKTTNAIMASWSNQMWQSVLNRVLRRITSNANGSNFFGASVNIR